METIAHFTDSDFKISGEQEHSACVERKAARAVIYRNDGKIVLVYTEKHGNHKLPGGGIDDGEDFITAVKREAIEEAGCEIELRNDEIVSITEERRAHNLSQVSYCGVADVVKDLGANQLTQDEIDNGYTAPIWVTPQEALELFKGDKPKTYIGQYMHARDMKFLENYLTNN